MKFVDFYNEEGSFDIVSENEILEVNISNIHPEIILEDNSMIIFEDVESYYDIITDANIFIPIDQDINLENLISGNIINSDTVSNFSYHGYDVNLIYQLLYRNHKIYYLIRTGLNNISI